MPEQADPKALEALIRKGESTPCSPCFPDGLGRLMGKRVVGRYFLDHVLDDGVHACIYLFTVDMEMEPLPGFKLTSWERGYGDMKMVPDLTTWRLLPWLPKTALVFCDVYTEEGEPIEEAPRWVLKRQLERARQRGWRVKTASELELYLFRESFDEARAKRYQRLTPVSNYLEDYHILQTSKEEPLVRAIRNRHGGRAGARGVLQGRVGPGTGGDQPPLRATALEMADRHVLYKHGVKEIAWQQGSSVTFMAKYDMGAAGSSFHLHSSVWDRAGKKNLFAARDRRGHAALPAVAGRADGHGARVRLLLRAHRQRLQALPGRLLRAHAHRLRLGQPHLRLPALRRGRRLPRGEPHPGRRREPLPGLRGHHRRGAPRGRTGSSSRPSATTATPTRIPSSPRCRRRCARPSASSNAPRSRARPSGTPW